MNAAYEVCFAKRDIVYLLGSDKHLVGWRAYDAAHDAQLKPMTLNRADRKNLDLQNGR